MSFINILAKIQAFGKVLADIAILVGKVCLVLVAAIGVLTNTIKTT
jgi:hypothetical protein